METDKLYEGDCMQILKDFPDSSVDLIITDPPYGVDYVVPNREVKFDKLKNDDNLDWLEPLLKELYRVLKENTHIYIFFGWKNLDKLLPFFKKYFDLKNILIVKTRHGSGIYNPYAFRNHYELVLYGMKGKRKFNELKRIKSIRFGYDPRAKNEYLIFYPDFIDYFYANEFNLDMVHPTQKDLDFVRFLIELSSNENEIVLDPFAGSGTTLLGSKQLNRRWVGIEVNSEYISLIKQRLSQENLHHFSNITHNMR